MRARATAGMAVVQDGSYTSVESDVDPVGVGNCGDGGYQAESRGTDGADVAARHGDEKGPAAILRVRSKASLGGDMISLEDGSLESDHSGGGGGGGPAARSPQACATSPHPPSPASAPGRRPGDAEPPAGPASAILRTLAAHDMGVVGTRLPGGEPVHWAIASATVPSAARSSPSAPGAAAPSGTPPIGEGAAGAASSSPRGAAQAGMPLRSASKFWSAPDLTERVDRSASSGDLTRLPLSDTRSALFGLERTGRLMKKGFYWRKRWVERLVLLRGRMLHYYDIEAVEESLGQLRQGPRLKLSGSTERLGGSPGFGGAPSSPASVASSGSRRSRSKRAMSSGGSPLTRRRGKGPDADTLRRVLGSGGSLASLASQGLQRRGGADGAAMGGAGGLTVAAHAGTLGSGGASSQSLASLSESPTQSPQLGALEAYLSGVASDSMLPVAPRGSLELDENTRVEEASVDGLEHCFSVVPSEGPPWHFQASSATEKAQWLDAIRQRVALVVRAAGRAGLLPEQGKAHAHYTMDTVLGRYSYGVLREGTHRLKGSKAHILCFHRGCFRDNEEVEKEEAQRTLAAMEETTPEPRRRRRAPPSARSPTPPGRLSSSGAVMTGVRRRVAAVRRMSRSNLRHVVACRELYRDEQVTYMVFDSVDGGNVQDHFAAASSVCRPRPVPRAAAHGTAVPQAGGGAPTAVFAPSPSPPVTGDLASAFTIGTPPMSPPVAQPRHAQTVGSEKEARTVEGDTDPTTDGRPPVGGSCARLAYTEDDVACVIGDLAATLAKLHSKQLVHRNVCIATLRVSGADLGDLRNGLVRLTWLETADGASKLSTGLHLNWSMAHLDLEVKEAASAAASAAADTNGPSLRPEGSSDGDADDEDDSDDGGAAAAASFGRTSIHDVGASRSMIIKFMRERLGDLAAGAAAACSTEHGLGALIALLEGRRSTVYAGCVAPEVARMGFFPPAADVWGLGIVAYALLLGRVPPPIAGSRREVLRSLCAGSVPRIGEEWGRISDDATSVLNAMLRPDPSVRMTARDVASSRWVKEARERRAATSQRAKRDYARGRSASEVQR